MRDPEQLKEGDVIHILEGDYPGIGIVWWIGDHDEDHTRVEYKRIANRSFKVVKESSDKRKTRLRYVVKLERLDFEKVLEARREELNETERVVSDAMFEGKSYVQEKE